MDGYPLHAMEFSSFYEPQMLLGEISEIFSAPVIPKMVIVGLNEENDSVLRLFKEILTKALDNLFVIEFCDQVSLVLIEVIVYVFSSFRKRKSYRIIRLVTEITK